MKNLTGLDLILERDFRDRAETVWQADDGRRRSFFFGFVWGMIGGIVIAWVTSA